MQKIMINTPLEYDLKTNYTKLIPLLNECYKVICSTYNYVAMQYNMKANAINFNLLNKELKQTRLNSQICSILKACLSLFAINNIYFNTTQTTYLFTSNDIHHTKNMLIHEWTNSLMMFNTLEIDIDNNHLVKCLKIPFTNQNEDYKEIAYYFYSLNALKFNDLVYLYSAMSAKLNELFHTNLPLTFTINNNYHLIIDKAYVQIPIVDEDINTWKLLNETKWQKLANLIKNVLSYYQSEFIVWNENNVSLIHQFLIYYVLCSAYIFQYQNTELYLNNTITLFLKRFKTHFYHLFKNNPDKLNNKSYYYDVYSLLSHLSLFNNDVSLNYSFKSHYYHILFNHEDNISKISNLTINDFKVILDSILQWLGVNEIIKHEDIAILNDLVNFKVDDLDTLKTYQLNLYEIFNEINLQPIDLSWFKALNLKYISLKIDKKYETN